jgi:hypothetical protein
MPIASFLKGENFDSETTRVTAVALEMACLALRTGDCADDGPRQRVSHPRSNYG